MLRTSDLRPRTILEILDAAFALYRSRFPTLFLTCLVFAIPVIATTFAIAGEHGRAQAGAMDLMWATLEQSGSRDPDAQRQAAENAQKMQDIATGEMLVFAAVESAMQAISRAGALVAMAFAVWRAATGRPPAGTATLVREAAGRLLPVAMLSVFVALGTALSSALGALACIWLMLLLVFGALLAPCGAIAALERGPGETALRERGGLRRVLIPFAILGHIRRRIFQLGMAGQTFARGAILVFLASSILSVVDATAGIVAGLLSGSWAAMLVAQQLADVFVMPFLGAACAIWYLDLRVRREGLDLQLMMAPAPPGTPRGASLPRRAATTALAFLSVAGLSASSAFAGDPPTPEAIRAARDNVFQREEFQYGTAKPESAIGRLISRLRELTEEFQRNYPVLFLVVIVGLVLLLLAIILHMVWTIRRANRVAVRTHDEKALIEAIRKLDARPFREAAEAAAREGRFDDAVRALYAALIVALDRRGSARFASHKTLADYCAETDAARDAEARAVLAGFEEAYPPGSFGRRPPDLATYNRLLGGVDALLNAPAVHGTRSGTPKRSA